MQLSGLTSSSYEDCPINDFPRLGGQINCQKNESGFKYSFYTSDMRPTNLKIKPEVCVAVAPAPRCLELDLDSTKILNSSNFAYNYNEYSVPNPAYIL